jgi:hypothetical protein
MEPHEVAGATLEYHGRPMAFAPSRTLCFDPHGPLDGDEPIDGSSPDYVGWQLAQFMDDGYSVFVELQPGDGTRYGLLLNGDGHGGMVVARVGCWSEGSVWLRSGVAVKVSECAPLAPTNAWSCVFFAWWLNTLRGVA